MVTSLVFLEAASCPCCVVPLPSHVSCLTWGCGDEVKFPGFLRLLVCRHCTPASVLVLRGNALYCMHNTIFHSWVRRRPCLRRSVVDCMPVSPPIALRDEARSRAKMPPSHRGFSATRVQRLNSTSARPPLSPRLSLSVCPLYLTLSTTPSAYIITKIPFQVCLPPTPLPKPQSLPIPNPAKPSPRLDRRTPRPLLLLLSLLRLKLHLLPNRRPKSPMASRL